ncbi:MAG: hypothetical protein A2Y24_06995 [Clostridiales bacterium GWE2_32_10]|nr:MAG: hypothetical protein A2Y24_06995 [Clostridiales bacterium GWE2_32_10]HBY19473.1 hypothetical protein [Clostridiales bacterium]
MQNRKDLRVHCNIITRIARMPENHKKEVNEKDKFMIEITNISVAGIHFVSNLEIEENGEYIVELPINNTIEKVNCKATRVYIQDGQYNSGARFKEMTYDTEKSIRSYVYKLQLSRRK